MNEEMLGNVEVRTEEQGAEGNQHWVRVTEPAQGELRESARVRQGQPGTLSFPDVLTVTGQLRGTNPGRRVMKTKSASARRRGRQGIRVVRL